MSFVQDMIYPHLPVFAQNWAISAYGYQWQKRRFGGIFQEELQKYKDRESYTQKQWHDYQTISLRRMLLHAFETVPFYREKYQASGYSRSDFEKFERHHLARLPFLEKEELRQFGTTTLLSAQREKGGAFFASSGSTGTPTKILYSNAFHQRINAAMEARVRNWAGVTMHDPRGMIGGRRILPTAENRPPFYRHNIFEHQTYFSAYHISPENASNYLEGMQKHRVRYMTGYAMSNYFLAAYFQEAGLEAPALKAVITSSEKLTPEMRKVFQDVYRCKTFDSYSGVENCGLISETPTGELVISPDTGIFEVLDKNRNPVAPGEEGEVVCTGLLNFDQPLIRYRIGDRLKLAADQIACSGLEMPVVEEIAGRMEDVIVTADGRQMVRFHGIFVGLPYVMEGQVVQHSLEDFTVNVVATSNFSLSEEATIIQRMKSQLGEQIHVSVNPVKEIPRTANGKFRAVISELIKS